MNKHSSQTVLLLLSPRGSPNTCLYRYKQEGSVVMFGGVEEHYYEVELNWAPLIQVGDWIVHMDR